MDNNEIILKKLGRINNFFEKDQDRPSATLVISGDIFKIYFDENVDLSLIKENLLKRQTKYQDELDNHKHQIFHNMLRQLGKRPMPCNLF